MNRHKYRQTDKYSKNKVKGKSKLKHKFVTSLTLKTD